MKTNRIQRHVALRLRVNVAAFLAAVAALSLAALTPTSSDAKLLVSRDDAIRTLFGEGAEARARTLYLTTEELGTLSEQARSKFENRRITYYEITRDETLLGIAVVDRHVVRSLSETVLIAITPDGEVKAVEILAWNEPDDYRPGGRWLDLAEGKKDIELMKPGEAMPQIAGATLSTRALTASVRRALAVGRYVLDEQVASQ